MDFFSDRLPTVDRAPAYEAALRQYFSSLETDIQLEVEPAPAESFAARLERLSIGLLPGAIHCTNSPHRLHAGATSCEPAALDLYFVSAGQISFTVEAGSIELGPGDLVLLPVSDEFVARTERVEMLALGVPGEMLRARTAESGWNVRRRIAGDSGFAACLGALLRAVTARHRDLSVAEGAVLQMAVLDAIALWSSTGADAQETDLSEQQQDRLAHLKALALRSLQSPDLDPERLAWEAGVSPRTLHRLFSASGRTFGHWLRECRLERCWMELTDPARSRTTIAAVAFAWGFSDLRTFNRAFSARYGMTPSAARQAGRGSWTDRRRPSAPNPSGDERHAHGEGGSGPC